ncbi:hypothetical protein [Legionella maioricensis]|uniref:Uncharacterized protein n=1 Tax=Legionella maioricensis TaxID=2896528 RepID=A0A9X2D2Z2_9GAMM|nr:hypothetical protein [Legionella maioricensis]MCL9685511.1 hypothetical protein [Legionella maioricensis]MCL9688875.1 hypothetical protein [Legionella maioricensis]
MPQSDKNLPEITDNGLDEFVDKLLNRIADESDEGKQALLATMAIAQSLYNKPLESWFTGWFYVFSRTRGPEIVEVMKSIEVFPDAYTRLQDIKLLAKKGEWHPDSSYNYYLFVELIKSVPGYKPLDKELVHPITIKIKDKIIDKIDSFMYQYKANQLSIASREKEREAIRQSMQKSEDKVVVFDNLDKAQVSAPKNPEKTHFCLILTNQIWHLSWIDLTGKVYKLYPTDELISLLVNQKEHEDEQQKLIPEKQSDELSELFVKQKEHKEEQLRLIHEKQLKKECLKAREIFLEKVQLHINPKDPATRLPLNNESLIARGVVTSFILRGKPNQYSLYWINTLGKDTEISLAAYPQFKMWLDSQGALSEEQLPQLKSYLLSVNTAKTLTGIEDFKNELQECLTQGPKKAVNTGSQKTIPKRLEMSLFADVVKTVAEQHKKTSDKEEPQQKPSTVAKELIDSEEIPSAPTVSSTRLHADKYAALSLLFSQRGKQIAQEPRDETQPGHTLI